MAFPHLFQAYHAPLPDPRVYLWERSRPMVVWKRVGEKAILQAAMPSTRSYTGLMKRCGWRFVKNFTCPKMLWSWDTSDVFNRQKNHEFLLEVFHKYVQEFNPTAHLLLVGTGELQKAIQKKVQQFRLTDQVHLLGGRPDVNRLLQAMDLFLFPSFMEGLSVSMVEAQCAGLPCVVSDRIPREAALTDQVSFLSLETAPRQWACEIERVRCMASRRTGYYQQIADAGYDIVKNAEWLQNYY